MLLRKIRENTCNAEQESASQCGPVAPPLLQALGYSGGIPGAIPQTHLLLLHLAYSVQLSMHMNHVRMHHM